MKVIIKKIYARQILDSRGIPTVEVEISGKRAGFGVKESKISVMTSVPSGASTGDNEAHELRDIKNKEWLGQSVYTAVSNINNVISREMIGMNALKQELIDETLNKIDGTNEKSNLGANAILAVSMASSKLAAAALEIPLWKYFSKISNTKEVSVPLPMFNFINGGKHANNNIDFQEYMIMPNGAKTFKQCLNWAALVFYNLTSILNDEGFSTTKGDEGGFAPNFKNNSEPLDYIMKAIEKSNLKPGKDVSIALDVAANEIFNNTTKMYELKGEDLVLTSKQLINYYVKLVEKYPIISIEDGMSEHDWIGFNMLTKSLGDKIQLVGDDLFVTNYKLLEEGIRKDTANAILIKLNQIGTITETIKTIKLARIVNYGIIISHRSGETEDTIIADFAVGVNSKQIKTGSLSRSERVAKYNQLIRISEKVSKFHGKYSIDLDLWKKNRLLVNKDNPWSSGVYKNDKVGSAIFQDTIEHSEESLEKLYKLNKKKIKKIEKSEEKENKRRRKSTPRSFGLSQEKSSNTVDGDKGVNKKSDKVETEKNSKTKTNSKTKSKPITKSKTKDSVKPIESSKKTKNK